MPTALSIAQALVDSKLHEDPPGSNRGRFIDKMLCAAGSPVGRPWCAAFVCWCFREANRQAPPFNSPGSKAIRRWFELRGLYSEDPQDLLEWKGALFGWTEEHGVHGHIGFVKSRWTSKGKVLAIETLEGNTSHLGGRNGDGAYSLRRRVPVDGKRRLWLLNTSGIPGGGWW